MIFDKEAPISAASVFNDVIGPVMRGPSSSHTAGSYHIGRTVRDLLGKKPVQVTFRFQPGSSYAKTYRQQGARQAYACAILNIPLTDKRFLDSLNIAADAGIALNFCEEPLYKADHPNAIEIEAKDCRDRKVFVHAKSTGGGTFTVDQINSWDINLKGKEYVIMVQCATSYVDNIINQFANLNGSCKAPEVDTKEGRALVQGFYIDPPNHTFIMQLSDSPGVTEVWQANPVYYVQKGKPIFTSAEEMVEFAESRSLTLGPTLVQYEASLLCLSEDDVMREMLSRLEVMKNAVDQGFDSDSLRLRLLEPSANDILTADRKGSLPLGGLQTQAAARALAVMHTTSSRGVVIAAPTGGAAGTVPGVIVTLMTERKLPEEKAALLLFAASGVGLITANRATFSAEVAGCQVEIGVAGAMAAAAVVEFAGGAARQAMDAASISLQNTMGSPCDHVQHMAEIPCHTRNAVAASAAFTCADLVIGGYRNPINFDETIDASYSCGKMLPVELRCTGGGGLSQAPTALAMKPKGIL